MPDDKFYLDVEELMMPKVQEATIGPAMKAFDTKDSGTGAVPKRDTYAENRAAQLLLWPDKPETPSLSKSATEMLKATVKPIADTVVGGMQLLNPDAHITKKAAKAAEVLEPEQDKYATPSAAPTIDTSMFAAGPVAFVSKFRRPSWVPPKFSTQGLPDDQVEFVSQLAGISKNTPKLIAKYGLPTDPFPSPSTRGREASGWLSRGGPTKKWTSFSDDASEALLRLDEADKTNISRPLYDHLTTKVEEYWKENPSQLFENAKNSALIDKINPERSFKIIAGDEPVPTYELVRLGNRVGESYLMKDRTGGIYTDAGRFQLGGALGIAQAIGGRALQGMRVERALGKPISEILTKYKGWEKLFGMDEFGLYQKPHTLQMLIAGDQQPLMMRYTMAHELAHAMFGMRDPFYSLETLTKRFNLSPERVANALSEARDASMYISRPKTWTMWWGVNGAPTGWKGANSPLGRLKDSSSNNGRVIDSLNSEEEVLADGLSLFHLNGGYAKKIMPTMAGIVKQVFNSDPQINSILEFRGIFPLVAAGAAAAAAQGVSNEYSRPKQSSPPSSYR